MVINLREIALKIFNYGLIKFGKFRLPSGIESPFYINLREMYSYPDLVKIIVDEMIKKISFNDVDAIAGIVTAGVPLASILAYKLSIPLSYVRIEKDESKMEKIVEGVVNNQRICIVDDVATTGYTMIKAINNLVEAGAKPVKAAVVIDREQGAYENISKFNVKLYSLMKVSDLLRILYEEARLTYSEYVKLIDYITKTRVKT